MSQLKKKIDGGVDIDPGANYDSPNDFRVLKKGKATDFRSGRVPTSIQEATTAKKSGRMQEVKYKPLAAKVGTKKLIADAAKKKLGLTPVKGEMALKAKKSYPIKHKKD